MQKTHKTQKTYKIAKRNEMEIFAFGVITFELGN